MYASLANSYEWNQLNANNALNEKISKVINPEHFVSPDRIPTAMLTLKNKLKSPIMTKLMDAISNGTIVLVYCPNIKIPVYLPFLITKPSAHSFVGYVLLNNLDTSCTEQGGEIFLNARKLKVSMESCYIGIVAALIGGGAKSRSTAILRSGSKIYANIVAECINRKHSTKLDPVAHNSILYLASRYYVGTIIGCRESMDKDSMRNYCLYNCKNVEYVEVQKIVELFGESDFDNISTFISKLASIDALKKRLGNLTVSNFIESYINMYDASMLLALENFNYFFYNVMAVNESTYSNNYQVLKNIVGDDGKKLYSDLAVTAMNL